METTDQPLKVISVLSRVVKCGVECKRRTEGHGSGENISGLSAEQQEVSSYGVCLLPTGNAHPSVQHISRLIKIDRHVVKVTPIDDGVCVEELLKATSREAI